MLFLLFVVVSIACAIRIRLLISIAKYATLWAALREKAHRCLVRRSRS